MIVAVAVVNVVQATVHQVVDMIAMGYGFMAASRAMDMIGCVAGALAVGAVIGIGGGDREHVLVHVIAMRVVQVAVVEIVDVAVMLDGGVAALGAVLVAVIRVVLVVAAGHGADSGRVGVVTPRHYKV